MRLTFAIYRNHVLNELCWVCDTRTQRCHAKQRQCPKCRVKWSFDHRKSELDILNAYCDPCVKNAFRASKTGKFSYQTALADFKKYDALVNQWLGKIEKGQTKIMETKEEVFPDELKLKEYIFLNLIKPGLPSFQRLKSWHVNAEFE